MKILLATFVFVTAVTLTAGKPVDVTTESTTSKNVSVSSFGASDVQTRSLSVNGVQRTLRQRSNYEQKPDGSCVKRITLEKNGKSVTKEIPISCEDAKKETEKRGMKISRDIQRQSDKIMNDIATSQKEMDETMKKEFGAGIDETPKPKQAKSSSKKDEIKQRSLGLALQNFRRRRANMLGLNGMNNIGLNNQFLANQQQHQQLAIAQQQSRINQLGGMSAMNYQSPFGLNNYQNLNMHNPLASNLGLLHNPLNMGGGFNNFRNVLL